MVVAANPLAAEAGLAILRKGGSAVDAGIATQMVLNLVEPQSSGIGGGAFILYWDQAPRQLASIDGRETAPAAATPELFLDADGKPLPREDAMASGLSVGVPGALAALKLAHDKYGKLPWAELFAAGHRARPRQASPSRPVLPQLLAEAPARKLRARKRALISSMREGSPWPVGHNSPTRRSPTRFETIARDGPDAFYKGDIARDIAIAVQNDPRGPGKLSAEDIARYRAKRAASRFASSIAPTRSAAPALRPPAR